MKRQDKYPDTPWFRFHNENPKNKFTGDCTIRAISTALEQSWTQTVMEMAELSCKNGYSPGSRENIDKYLQSKGWVKHKQPRKSDNTKYSGKEFCNFLSYSPYYGAVIASIGAHHIVAIIPDPLFQVWDTWDSTDSCIGNYWTAG